MKKNIFYILTITTLLVIILILIISLQKVEEEKKELTEENIIGTYIYGDEHNDATYIACFDEGDCIRYKQNQRATELKYKKNDSYYTLSNNDIIVLKNDLLLLINKNDVMVFKKIDKVPMKINVLE